MPNKITWAFFGTEGLSITVLNEMEKAGYVPSLIITTEDKPKGRKMLLTPPDAKLWADSHSVPVLQLKTLRNEDSFTSIRDFKPEGFDVFVVASYGKIIPQNILDIPRHKTLNIHPSLLPKLRGPSPIQSAILSENETGVSIMRLDSEMDHGPILAQKKIDIEWPPYADELEKVSGVVGAQILCDLLPKWIAGEIQEVEQDHTLATLCKKIAKADAEIILSDDPTVNLRKIRAFNIWPVAYFFENNEGTKTRVLIKKARIENNSLVIERVVPEGKKEMDYTDYLRGKKN